MAESRITQKHRAGVLTGLAFSPGWRSHRAGVPVIEMLGLLRGDRVKIIKDVHLIASKVSFFYKSV
jgi:hypothetical protein